MFHSEGLDMVKVCVKGQSFMLHQIRLMIGASIMVAVGAMPEIAIETALLTRTFIRKLSTVFSLYKHV